MVKGSAFLLDIDGVLHVGDEMIPGGPEALVLLREREIPFRLVTNTTSRSRRLVVERLVHIGLEVFESDVLTPAALAVVRCREQGHKRVALHVADNLREDFASLGDEQSDPDAVILGDLGKDFTWERMNTIFGQIDGGAEFIALQANRVFQREEGLVLDAGPFVAALEYATGKAAIVTGKPSAEFFTAALNAIGATKEDTLMIGDDIEADVGGAIDHGLSGVLVKTGKFRAEPLEASGVKPTAIIDSIADLPELIDE